MIAAEEAVDAHDAGLKVFVIAVDGSSRGG